jgi:hypothetical protein
MAQSRTVNGHLKTRERERRQIRMLGLLKSGKFPYTPSVMSWVSHELGKPSAKITPADVTKLSKELAAAPAKPITHPAPQSAPVEGAAHSKKTARAKSASGPKAGANPK